MRATQVPIAAARMTGLLSVIAQPHVTQKVKEEYPEVVVDAAFSNSKMALIRSAKVYQLSTPRLCQLHHSASFPHFVTMNSIQKKKRQVTRPC